MGDACVIHDDIHVAHFFHCKVCHRLHAGPVSDIDRTRHAVDFRGNRLRGPGVDISNENFCTFGCKFARDASAKARACTCHDGGFIE